MMKPIKWPRSFKANPSAGISALELELSAINHIAPIIDSVIKALSSNPLLSAYAMNFTLVHMRYAPTDYQFGFLNPAPPFVDQDMGLVFTFALTPVRTSQKFDWPKAENKIYGRDVAVWGTSTSKFCSVFISRNELASYNCLAMLAPVLRSLYNLVGSITKNFMNFGRKTVPDCQPQYFHVYDATCNVPKYEDLVDSVEYADWIYSAFFWEHLGFLAALRELPAGFYEYWALYLNDNVYRFSMDTAARSKIEATLRKELAVGAQSFISYFLSDIIPTKMSPNAVAFTAMFFQYAGRPLAGKRESEIASASIEAVTTLLDGLRDNGDLVEGFRTALKAAAPVIVDAVVDGAVNPKVSTVISLMDVIYANH